MTTRAKLAALAASAVVIALIAAAMAFNLFIGWKVEADAVDDIELALGLNDEAVGTGRTPNYLALDSSFRIEGTERRWIADDEKKLAAWFSEHPSPGVVSRVTLDGWTCYAAIMPQSYFSDYYDDSYGGDYYYPESYWDGYAAPGAVPDATPDAARGDGYYVAYIDTASEESLIVSVNTAFGIIGVIGALAAAAAGYATGRRIDEARDAQKRFYENMSHDLKTPLAAIRGYAEGARDNVLDTREATRAIIRETDTMTDMINEILNLSRLESGSVQPSREAIEVADFVQDCLMPFEGAVRSRSIDVQLDLATGEIQADLGLFDHALSNVLANAVRHAASRICVRYDGNRLSVWNDGETPPPEEIPRLFERFHAGAGGSTGIGLAIAKEVAVLHGWNISARVVDGGLEIALAF